MPALAPWSMEFSEDERWLSTLRDRAARLAFPDWAPTEGDWSHLYTGFADDGTPYTEVAVYRESDGHERIHYHRYTGDELAAFWSRLLRHITE